MIIRNNNKMKYEVQKKDKINESKYSLNNNNE